MAFGYLADQRLFDPVNLRRLTGTSSEARIINEIIAELEALKVSAGVGVTLHRTPKGTVISAAPPKPSTGGGGLNFRGEWVFGLTYPADDAVIISRGYNAGLYIATSAAGIDSYPWAGTPWMQVSRMQDVWL
jgi:hypothetical protein